MNETDTARSLEVAPSELLFAKRLPTGNGYTWTLASRLGDMLFHAEQLFGERDTSYTILGIEVGPGGPQLWYPGNRKHIVVQLGRSVLSSHPTRAYWQLAHECIHLLSPSGGRNSLVLEEGIAVSFSHWYLRNHMGAAWSTSDARYERAEALFAEATAIEQSFAASVRRTYGRWFDLNGDDLRAVTPGLSVTLAESLAATWSP